MKVFSLALMVAGSLVFCWPVDAQAQAPVPERSTPDHLFQLPQTPGDSKPLFKLRIPDGQHVFVLPELAVQEPVLPRAKSVDPGMIVKPHGFAQQPTRPAAPHDIYPDLNIMPVEIAQLDLAPAVAKPKPEAIPLLWPQSRIEPIPINWKDYPVVPVQTGAETPKP
ncbi:MAG TPA: hypothetical protein VGJ21_24195 [Terracidiphilus sp.]